MDCKKAKKIMSAYVDGMLENADKSAFEEHIHTCENCKQELDLLKNTLNILADAKYSAPENFSSEVREKLKSAAMSDKKPSFAHWGKISTCAAAFIILAAVAIGNPVWKEFSDRTTQITAPKTEKFVQNKDNNLTKKSDADVVEKSAKNPADEKITGTQNTEIITKTDKISSENFDEPAKKSDPVIEKTHRETIEKQESLPENTASKPEDTAAVQEDTAAVQNATEKQSDNSEANNKLSRAAAGTADAVPISLFSDGGENTDSNKESDSNTATFKAAAGGGASSYAPPKIVINSRLNLAETEKKISEILGFEVMGENGEITLSVTAEQYNLLAEKLGKNPDFDGFDELSAENITEISIFTK